ncbi:Glycosyltransferase involved in cell wall bisynthesis [Mucilaginibacter gossypiicola]|uniref:Glycosyltransferase involved in cell wall bisynthesis n=1 Tax=Mucilaginibacter gossypiicola TaxID=551995 RepID=A0A1H8NB67_9SPHI|nr:glycosyltransferase [Mucilaginibacter gossypiicola]SEO26758.1 Glycosyltransferase involved in cell wall bisynthesis [Mucilaginibacter gossypiicola]
MEKKIKVLNVLGGLTAGGVETWLYNVLGQVDFNKYQIDFMTFSDKKGVYDDLVTAMGCKVYYQPKTKNVLKVAQYYIKTVKENGYDIVHCHRHLLCGLFFIFNRFTKAQFIAHSHNTSTDSKLFIFKYFSKASRAIIKKVKYKLACSEDASIALFDKVETIIDYGIDTSKFVLETPKNQELLKLFNLDAGNIIIGHVGRFTEQKNHTFIIEIARKIVAQNPNYHFVFIGDGILEEQIRQSIIGGGLQNNVHMAGTRTDVNKFMSGLFDMFLFPSLYEGLGIVLLEAQSAGLPVIFTDVIPQRVDVIATLVNRISLDKGADFWANHILNEVKIPSAAERRNYHEEFNNSEYSIKKSAAKLLDFYKNIISQG